MLDSLHMRCIPCNRVSISYSIQPFSLSFSSFQAGRAHTVSYGQNLTREQHFGARSGAIFASSQPEPSAFEQSRLITSLPATTVLADLELRLVRTGKGQAVVVASVKPGSVCEKAGICIGLKVAAVADPMRPSTMYELMDRPSLRFVLETLRMQRKNVTDIAFEQLLSPAEIAAQFGPSASSAEVTDPSAASVSSYDPDQSPLTIGERLSAQFTQDQKAAGASTTGVSDVSKRIERRKSYLEEVEKRNDSGLGVLLIAAFLGPAFVILAVAFGSGYMDELYLRTLSAQ